MFLMNVYWQTPIISEVKVNRFSSFFLCTVKRQQSCPRDSVGRNGMCSFKNFTSFPLRRTKAYVQYVNDTIKCWFSSMPSREGTKILAKFWSHVRCSHCSTHRPEPFDFFFWAYQSEIMEAWASRPKPWLTCMASVHGKWLLQGCPSWSLRAPYEKCLVTNWFFFLFFPPSWKLEKKNKWKGASWQNLRINSHCFQWIWMKP